MRRWTKVWMAIAAGVLVLGIGAGVGDAVVGDDDRPLTGATRERAVEVALARVGSGTVVGTEAGDDGTAYSVEIRREDGTVVDVGLDTDFRVIGTETDDADTGADDDA